MKVLSVVTVRKRNRFNWRYLAVGFAFVKEPQGDIIHQFADREH